ISSAISCQKGVGSEATLTAAARHSASSRTTEERAGSEATTRAAPALRAAKISSQLVSKLIEQKCSMRSAGASAKRAAAAAMYQAAERCVKSVPLGRPPEPEV